MADKQTYAGATLGISTTSQSSDLNAASFAALTFTAVGGVGSIGEWSTAPNIISYATLTDQVTQKQKGLDNGGDPKIEVAFDAADAGQDALRAASLTKVSYAFKAVLPDGTIWYNRGIVGGPERPGGKNEDFILEVFTLGFNQRLVIV